MIINFDIRETYFLRLNFLLNLIEFWTTQVSKKSLRLRDIDDLQTKLKSI